MLFEDAAIFGLVMLLMGLLLTASVLCVGLILSLFSGRGQKRR